MSALTVYVAGASAEVDMIVGYMAALREGGVHITHDWTPDVILARRMCVSERELAGALRMKAASEDFAGVASADILWLVVPEASSVGCWAELGYAHGVGTPIVASGPCVLRTIFTEFALRFTTHDSALAYLLHRAKGVA